MFHVLQMLVVSHRSCPLSGIPVVTVKRERQQVSILHVQGLPSALVAMAYLTSYMAHATY